MKRFMLLALSLVLSTFAVSQTKWTDSMSAKAIELFKMEGNKMVTVSKVDYLVVAKAGLLEVYSPTFQYYKIEKILLQKKDNLYSYVKYACLDKRDAPCFVSLAGNDDEFYLYVEYSYYKFDYRLIMVP